MLAAQRHDENVKGCGFPKEREPTAIPEGQQLTLRFLIGSADKVRRIGLFVEPITRSNVEFYNTG
jgi:hypothetical protein